ncbi:N-6 DNA methylase [Paenisporosarcina antarctica]|uniref:SAM-dependent DNA methyltransferase n=1 Tax=Paenisporosarcina antarctica TaxID=417367 RepID=A0A4V1ANL2_9BACL|nr:N-6 DNA methylase [Paenisporosarcina antarctica]QBP43165.1 SAM-dependent DNA methyltransferase [Paenisporosarcina antarctica]
MSGLSESVYEKIIKSKKRVQNHGEVFTPKRIVKQMLDLPNIRESCQNLTSTFLEPAAGEGAFLVEVLNRKMKMVVKNYGDDLIRYENYSLLALSTLYGVELLEDNAQKCAMNMYQVYYEAYRHQAIEHGAKVKNKVLDSAKLIISNNIAQGNFLTKLSANGNPIVFSEWQLVNFRKDAKTIKIQRTEYTIEDILDGTEKERGEPSTHSVKVEQLQLFDFFDDEEIAETVEKRMKYVPVKITDVYKEEMEVVHG